jgi:hypothetical protein
MGEMRSAYQHFSDKPEEQSPFGHLGADGKIYWNKSKRNGL